MWLDLATNLTPFYKLVLPLVISHCFGLPSLSRAGPQARSTTNLCPAITLKAQVGHRLGPQPHFLRAAQGHQAPARVFRGVEKRPGVGFSGGNVQTNGRNIVNMTPPGPGVSTRGELQIHLSFFQLAFLNNVFEFHQFLQLANLGLGLNSAITGGNNNNQRNNNNVNQPASRIDAIYMHK